MICSYRLNCVYEGFCSGTADSRDDFAKPARSKFTHPPWPRPHHPRNFSVRRWNKAQKLRQPPQWHQPALVREVSWKPNQSHFWNECTYMYIYIYMIICIYIYIYMIIGCWLFFFGKKVSLWLTYVDMLRDESSNKEMGKKARTRG